jgi:hypothetical protein
LKGVLEIIDTAAIPKSAKNKVHNMAKDLIALSEEVRHLEAQLAKDKESRVNNSTNEPSGKKPEWEKGKGPDPKPTRPNGKKGKPGGRRTGSGNRGKKDLTPDQQAHNELSRCVDCGTDLTSQKPVDANKRIIEDIKPPAEKSVVIEETSDRKWCPTCQKIVSARSELALDGSDIGLNATVLMAWLWVVPALSLPNIVAYLSSCV